MPHTITIRRAEPHDCALILDFIRALADYEHMLDDVVATEALLHEWLFEHRVAEVIFAVCDGEEVGFALFFHSFSTFLGKAGIYLEDLFVKPKFRSLGIGKRLLSELARLTLERGCGRLEWQCLDWNAPSIAFYKSLGAVTMDDWTVYRLTDSALQSLSSTKTP